MGLNNPFSYLYPVRTKGMYDFLPKSIQSYDIILVILAGPFHYAQMRYIPNFLCQVLFRRRQIKKTKTNVMLVLFFGAGEGNRTLVFSLGS